MPLLCSALGLGKLASLILLFIFAALQRDSTSALYKLIAAYSDTMHILSIIGVAWLLGCISQVPVWRTAQGLRASTMFALQGCFSVCFLSVGQVRIANLPGPNRLAGFGVVSLFRWANSFYILCLGLSLCLETERPEWYRPTASQSLVVALCGGLVVTLPWLFCCGDDLEGLALWSAVAAGQTRDAFALALPCRLLPA